jgi:hypothetical protein
MPRIPDKVLMYHVPLSQAGVTPSRREMISLAWRRAVKVKVASAPVNVVQTSAIPCVPLETSSAMGVLEEGLPQKQERTCGSRVFDGQKM